jgi:hypothetical protein
MATFGKIRRIHVRNGLSLSEISRRTSLSRNTIRAWLRKPQGKEAKYRCERRPGKLAAFEAVLVRALEAHARRINNAKHLALPIRSRFGAIASLHPGVQPAGSASAIKGVSRGNARERRPSLRPWRNPGTAPSRLGSSLA